MGAEVKGFGAPHEAMRKLCGNKHPAHRIARGPADAHPICRFLWTSRSSHPTGTKEGLAEQSPRHDEEEPFHQS